jgi:hypothetical protein
MQEKYQITKYPEKNYKVDGSHIETIKAYQITLKQTAILSILSIGIIIFLAIWFAKIDFALGTYSLIVLLFGVIILLRYYFRIPKLYCSKCRKKMKRSYKAVQGVECLFLICRTCRLYIPAGISRE